MYPNVMFWFINKQKVNYKAYPRERSLGCSRSTAV